MKAVKRNVQRFFFFLGLALFAYLIYKIKPAVLYEYLSQVGPKFIFIILLSSVWYWAYALAWEIFLKNLSNRVHLWQIFKIKICGEAMNSVTPFSWGAGDPGRVYLLKTHIPVTEGTASVVVDRTLNNLAIALFMLIGILITFLKFDLPAELKIGLPIALSVIIGGSLFLYIRSHEGLFEFLLDILRKLRIKRNFSEKTLQNVAEIDHHISHFYKMNKKGFFLAYGLHFFGRLMGVVEIYLAASFLGHSLSMLDSYLLASMTVIVNMIFTFVPGSIGVMEGAYTGVFAMLHLDPAIGTSIQIIRRARMVFWVAIGFIFMAQMKQKDSKPNKA